MKKIIYLAMGAFFAFSTMYVEGMPGDDPSAKQPVDSEGQNNTRDELTIGEISDLEDYGKDKLALSKIISVENCRKMLKLLENKELTVEHELNYLTEEQRAELLQALEKIKESDENMGFEATFQIVNMLKENKILDPRLAEFISFCTEADLLDMLNLLTNSELYTEERNKRAAAKVKAFVTRP